MAFQLVLVVLFFKFYSDRFKCENIYLSFYGTNISNFIFFRYLYFLFLIKNSLLIQSVMAHFCSD